MHSQGWIAASDGPVSLLGSIGKPGKGVEIYTAGNGYSPEWNELVITHELGHVIGFKHTGTQEGVLVPSTIQYEKFSHMNTGNDVTSEQRFSFTAFSTYDLLALNNMYPRTIASWIQTPETVAYYHTAF